MLTDPTEARPLIRTELNVKTPNGRQQMSRLVDCVATLVFVSKDFVRPFSYVDLQVQDQDSNSSRE
jgi:hypothetical protein